MSLVEITRCGVNQDTVQFADPEKGSGEVLVDVHSLVEIAWVPNPGAGPEGYGFLSYRFMGQDKPVTVASTLSSFRRLKDAFKGWHEYLEASRDRLASVSETEDPDHHQV